MALGGCLWRGCSTAGLAPEKHLISGEPLQAGPTPASISPPAKKPGPSKAVLSNTAARSHMWPLNTGICHVVTMLN